MRVFLSSVIQGFEVLRGAAADAIDSLGHDVIRAEDFPAVAMSPQGACLQGVRDADVVVLVLGARYGATQPSGKSATHEEYDEARSEGRAILVFIEAGVEHENASFVDDVTTWVGGTMVKYFADSGELRRRVLQALRHYEVETIKPVDDDEILGRARAELPPERSGVSAPAQLDVVVAAGPARSVLRPAELEAPELATRLQEVAMFGDDQVLDQSSATSRKVQGGRLIVDQGHQGLTLDELGTVRVWSPGESETGELGLRGTVQEDVMEATARALGLASAILDELDSQGRLTAVVPLVALSTSGMLGWRTREEIAADPNRMAVNPGAPAQAVATLAAISRPRPELGHARTRLAEDLTILLRREFEH